MKKLLSELIDELGIINCKIYHLMERDDDESFKKLKALNKYRSELKNAINSYFNEREEIKT